MVNGRMSLARSNKLGGKLWGLVKIMTIEIWQSRNNHNYDKKLLPQQTIINKINAKLKTIILAHYKKHKLNDPLDISENQFCIHEALVKLENDLLITPLQHINIIPLFADASSHKCSG